MPYFTYLDNYTIGSVRYSYGITDLQIIQQGTQTKLVSFSTGTEGGLTSFAIGANGRLEKKFTAATVVNGISGTNPNMMVTKDGDLWVAGTAPDSIMIYSVSNKGVFSKTGTVNGVGSGNQLLPLIASAGDALVLTSPKLNGATFYTVNGDNLSNSTYIADAWRSYIKNPSAMTAATVNGRDYFIIGSQTERGISVYESDGGTIRRSASVSARTGIALMVPTEMTTTEVDGKTFVIVGSSPTSGTSGALTVFELDEIGKFTIQDHLLDTRNTRFGQTQTVTSFEIDGRTYIAAGGGDLGLSLFGLSNTGRLIHLESIEDTTTMGIGGVTALKFSEINGALYLYASSENEQGVTAFQIDRSNVGQNYYGDDTDETISGTNNNDWIFGGAGNDILRGGNGSDIISDGIGEDELTGGGGGDTFVLAGDDQLDTITDFNPAEDRIDLSGWRYLTTIDDLNISSAGNAYRITFRDEVLIIQPGNGVTLTKNNIIAALMINESRTWEPPSSKQKGTDGDDELIGTYGIDTLDGGDGNDTIYGDDGDDIIIGGHGIDTAILDIDFDRISKLVIDGDKITMETSDGKDVFESIEFFQFTDRLVAKEDLRLSAIKGSPFSDFLEGTHGVDEIYGYAGDDVLYGFNLSDTLYGGDDNDTIHAGRHGDFIYGDDGDDMCYGNGGNDYINGGGGNDVLKGGSRHDTLIGSTGSDILFGNGADDTLDGGKGSDILKGGGGNDILTGGLHDDFLKGGQGRDTFIFNKGDGMDRIKDFKPGQDLLELDDALSQNLKVRMQTIITDDGALLTFSETDSILFMGLDTKDGLADSII